MDDKAFITEIRRGLIIIMRAMIKRYCLGWADFMPKEITLPDVLTIDVTERSG